MYYCEPCREQNCWTTGYNPPVPFQKCVVCCATATCYDVPSDRTAETVLERADRKSPPESMIKDMFGPAGPGVPWIPNDPLYQCEVEGCDREQIRHPMHRRRLCEFHAYPAERQKSDRRAAIEATKKKKAKSD